MQPEEIITSPFTIWIAPVGTAFPALTEEPGEDWTRIGSNGTRSYSEGGVTTQHSQQREIAKPAGSTAPTYSFSSGEEFRIRLELLDLTLEQYALALGQNAVSATSGVGELPGYRTLGLNLRPRADSVLALLARGPSPYDEDLISQFEVPRCQEAGGGPKLLFRKGQPAGITVDFLALEDPDAVSIDQLFGRLLAQDFDAFSPPVFAVYPVIEGDPQVGITLTGAVQVDNGSVSLAEWLRDDEPIEGAEGASYTLTSADEGALISWRVTGSGDGGTVVQTSAPVGPVEAIPAPAAINQGSAQFPAFNRQYAGHGGTIQFANTNLTSAGDPVMAHNKVWAHFTMVAIPWARTDRNRAFQCWGNNSPAGGGLSTQGQAIQSALFGAQWSTVSGDQDFFITRVRDSSSNQIDFRHDLTAFQHDIVLLVASCDGAGTFTPRTFAPGETRLIGSTTSNSGFNWTVSRGSYFTVGDCLNAGTDLTDTAANSTNSAWPGAIFLHGFIEGSEGSDAEWQAIVEGAALDTIADVTQFRAARDYRGVETLSSALAASLTGDTTATGTVLGDVAKGPGSRQSVAKYLTFDQLPDGYVADVKPGAETGTVALTGGASAGLTGRLFARILDPATDAVKVAPFQIGTVAAIASAAITAAPFSGWGVIEVWAESDPDTTFRMSNWFGIGDKGAMIGQSPVAIPLEINAGNFALSGATSYATLGANRAQCFPLIAEMTGRHTGAKGFAARLHEVNSGRAVCVVDTAVNGTSPQAWIDDSDAGRDWSDDETLAALIGTDKQPTMTWLQSVISADQEDWLDGLLKGTGPDAADHTLFDGTVFDASGYKLALCPPARDTEGGASSGPFDFDNMATTLPASVLAAQVAYVAANPSLCLLGPYMPDIAIDNDQASPSSSGDADLSGPHPSPHIEAGCYRLAYRMGEACARAKGLSTLSDPAISGWAINGGRTVVTVTINLPNSGTGLQTANAAAIGGFEFSEDGGTTRSRTGFSAAIVGSSVELTKDSGSWAAGVRWYYAPYGPYSLGTNEELNAPYDGHLYDGSDIEDDLGLPVANGVVDVVLA